MMNRIRPNIVLCLLFYSMFTVGQTKPFDYFYVSNTLTPTLVLHGENTTNIEVVLMPAASITKVPIMSKLSSGYSFLGTVTDVPVNFSSKFLQSFQVKDNASTTNVSLSVKQLKGRDAPFTLTFNAANLSDSWTITTKGWVAKGIDESVKEAIVLNKNNAAFLLAYNNAQGLLAFDIEKSNSSPFDGLFTVEASKDGVEGSWRTLFIKDDCNNPFLEKKSLVRVKLLNTDRYVRFTLSNTITGQTIKLNNFSVTSYNSEDIGEFTSIAHTLAESLWHLKSHTVSDYLELIVPNNVTKWSCSVYDLSGKLILSTINQSKISVNELIAGSYILSVKSNSKINKTLKFIKK